MATIKDVARAARVSVASVSRYLNAPDMVREETRERIADAIRMLDYQPSALAVSMRTRQTQDIALIIQSITNMYYIDLYGALRDIAEKHAYSLSLFTTDRDENRLRKILDNVVRNNYAGIILGFLDEPGVQLELERVSRETPLVLITCDPSQRTIDNIHLDARDGLEKATDHLLSIGKKRIAYIGAAPDSVISTEKYIGYAGTLERAGRKVNQKLVFHGAQQHFSTGMEAVRDFLALPEPPDGIACATDDIGIGCIKQLLVSRIPIPQDVAVVGFNGISVLHSYEPELTTVAHPIPDMADTAIRMLLDRIRGDAPAAARRIVVKGELTVNNSTVIMPGKKAQRGMEK